MTVVARMADFRCGGEEIRKSSVQLAIVHIPQEDSDVSCVALAQEVLKLCWRVVKKGGVCVVVQHDHKKIGSTPRHLLIYQVAMDIGFQFYEHKIWYRQERSLYRKTFGNISIYAKGKPKRPSASCFYHRDVWHLPDSMKRGWFTNAFPEEIPKWLIEAFTSPNDIVFDPFVGTGTTLRAAYSLGRHAVGYDIEEKHREFWDENWEYAKNWPTLLKDTFDAKC
jgi:DNA modification methylase